MAIVILRIRSIHTGTHAVRHTRGWEWKQAGPVRPGYPAALVVHPRTLVRIPPIRVLPGFVTPGQHASGSTGESALAGDDAIVDATASAGCGRPASSVPETGPACRSQHDRRSWTIMAERRQFRPLVVHDQDPVVSASGAWGLVCLESHVRRRMDIVRVAVPGVEP